VIDNQSAGAITGTYAGYGNLTTNTFGTVLFEFNYAGGTGGNDLVLTVIPEPSTLALVGAGLLGAVVLLRRRRK
jgi:hypothetical protein